MGTDELKLILVWVVTVGVILGIGPIDWFAFVLIGIITFACLGAEQAVRSSNRIEKKLQATERKARNRE